MSAHQPRKKLIEVALPLEAINREAAREKSIRHGHPSTLHLWWARRPLAACRAVIFASLVDDPSSRPDLWPTVEAQEKKRQELFRLIEELVKWENSNDERVLGAARAEIMRSCDGNPPPVYDPFCGGGSIPLEAQRLGLEAHGSDLNPVPVLITKALIELPPKFAGRPPVNPEAGGVDWSSKGAKAQKKAKKADGFGDVRAAGWKGAAGLAADIRYYGNWMREEAMQRIGKFYPKAYVMRAADGTYRHATPQEIAAKKAEEMTVIAWLWGRTVASPNPAAKGAHVPLVRSFWLSKKAGKRVWLEPVVDSSTMTYRLEVRAGNDEPRAGTVKRTGGECLLTGSPIPLDYVRSEGKAGRIGARLLAVVAEGTRGRVYLPASPEHERSAQDVPLPENLPETDLPAEALGFRVQNYGMTKHRHLFTNRQLAALTTFGDLVADARAKVLADSNGDEGYADAVATYLGFVVDKLADLGNALCRWEPLAQCPRQLFARQTISMVWDFAEGNPLGHSSGSWEVLVDAQSKTFLTDLMAFNRVQAGQASQRDAQKIEGKRAGYVFCTDPPYYDNVPYADLSDFFYVWLRRSLSPYYPQLLGTVLVPKAQELVAEPFRHGGKDAARDFFEAGMGNVFSRMRETANPDYPTTIFYAFKQSEGEDDDDDESESTGRASTGWETFLQGLLNTGWQVDGTWPMRTECVSRMRSMDSNALASSIVLVCRPRPLDAPVSSRRDFLGTLRRELPEALRLLQKGNTAPVDLAQAAIGPGMAVFSRYARVLEADGTTMGVRAALGLINQMLDEVLAEQEGEFDAETRWALAWCDQHGFGEGAFGVAETLSKAKNTSVSGMVEAGIVAAKSGKVRLLKKDELDPEWNPASDARLTNWEVVHHLIRTLDAGEEATAKLLARVRAVDAAKADATRDLAYRLYSMSERRKRAQDALGYNALVLVWPELEKLAQGLPAEQRMEEGRLL
jgi:putative DNA methylase